MPVNDIFKCDVIGGLYIPSKRKYMERGDTIVLDEESIKTDRMLGALITAGALKSTRVSVKPGKVARNNEQAAALALSAPSVASVAAPVLSSPRLVSAKAPVENPNITVVLDGEKEGNFYWNGFSHRKKQALIRKESLTFSQLQTALSAESDEEFKKLLQGQLSRKEVEIRAKSIPAVESTAPVSVPAPK